jgi:hypothetical protein
MLSYCFQKKSCTSDFNFNDITSHCNEGSFTNCHTRPHIKLCANGNVPSIDKKTLSQLDEEKMDCSNSHTHTENTISNKHLNNIQSASKHVPKQYEKSIPNLVSISTICCMYMDICRFVLLLS